MGTIKRKVENGHIPYEVMNEFYVMEKKFLTGKEYKEVESKLIKDFNKTSDKSEFSRPFWDDLEAYHIPPINSGLKDQLNQNLRLVK